METITLSYEPGSDFAVALEELIRNSEGVQVERHGQQEDELAAVVKERIRQLEAGEVETIPNEQVFIKFKSIKYEKTYKGHGSHNANDSGSVCRGM